MRWLEPQRYCPISTHCKIQGTLGLTVFDVVPNLIEWTASDLINEVIETDQQLQKN